MDWNQSEKLPTSSLRFSLLKDDLKDFLDILEILQFPLQPIFEILLEIPFGTMWKIVIKLGQKSA